MFRVSTHPFISFEFDTKRLQPATWLKLGEAMSKCEHLSGYPLKPAAAATMSRVYLAKGVHATTAIEGNTLTEEDAERLVAGKKSSVPPSRQYLEQELQNILEAIGNLDQALASGQRLPITVDRLCQLNALILRKTPQPPEVRPGELRTHGVGVNMYRAPAWNDVPELLDTFVGWIDQIRWGVDDSRESRFVAAVLAAILAHLYIAWIHPFGNGNGRLARLIEVQ
ncbi:MAG: Fic family protein, partial [Propionicimonas sp.]|nr:Fic family protein [Propionicimonas sp.]